MDRSTISQPIRFIPSARQLFLWEVYFIVYHTLCLQWKLSTLSNIAYMYHMITLLFFYWIWYPYVILLCGLFINMYRNIYINSQFIKLYTISGRDGINSQGVAYSWRSLCAVDGALSQIICDYKEVQVEKFLKIKSICCEITSLCSPPLILCNHNIR